MTDTQTRPEAAESLDARVERLARTPVLLVATDFDGTLAPIVRNPADAKPDHEAMVALTVLSAIHQTHVAVISGRSLKELAELTEAPPGVHLVGSHGSEFDPDFAQRLSEKQVSLLQEAIAELEKLAEADDGFLVETKPASVAFHYRNAPEDKAKTAMGEIVSGIAARPGIHVRMGKMVIELAVVATDKGKAMEILRHRVGATAAIFLGDDKTDEDAFDKMSGPDVAVKVGEGATLAPYRVDDPHAVSKLLADLADARAEWLSGKHAVHIEEHSLLSDSRTIALVTPTGRVAWMCAPRIDSPALFAELLGGESAGHYSIAPCEPSSKSVQTYNEGSMLLRTEWDGVALTDYLDISGGRHNQRPGRTDLIRVIEGSGRVRIEFAPRLDFGRVQTRLEQREDGLEVEDALEPIVLRSPGVEWEIRLDGVNHTAVAEVDLSETGPLTLELRFGSGNLRPSVIPEPERRRQSEQLWTGFSEQLELPGLRRDLVRRSALAIRGLVYGPSGAIAAAATTSLPETLGGVRNWDYRYCWPRDAAMSALALVRLGATGEAMRLLDWTLGIVDDLSSPDRLRPIYTVSGGDLPVEAEIGELSGYAGSRPVRIGNAASGQIQLDVIGPIVELIYELGERGAPLSAEHWRLTEALVGAVERRWMEPDHGIWEIRMARRHHVHSKVMCWLAVDRGIKLADRVLGRDKPEWRTLRDEIAKDVLDNGFNESAGAFTTAYGYEELDAAALFVGLTGMIDPSDERFAKTVDAVIDGLKTGPVVYRYKCDDGLPGEEGGFHICTSWLIESLDLIGRRDEALELFEQMCELAGPTGLLSEEWDPKTERALGNHPQAYSHLGVINCAVRLSR